MAEVHQVSGVLNTVPYSLRYEWTEKHLPPVNVQYIDENIVMINKLPDIKINSDDPEEITVESQLRKAFPKHIDLKLSNGFRFIHRLDFATTGVLCVAFTKKGCSVLSRAFEDRRVTKHYLALVRGHMTSIQPVEIEVAIGRDGRYTDHCRMCVASNAQCQQPRSASTTLIPLEIGVYNEKPATKVLLVPRTGRTHQLRVHCAHIGHTIVGDYTYSDRKDTSPERMMLHAYRLVIKPKQCRKNKQKTKQGKNGSPRHHRLKDDSDSVHRDEKRSDELCTSNTMTALQESRQGDVHAKQGDDTRLQDKLIDVVTPDPFLGDPLWQLLEVYRTYEDACLCTSSASNDEGEHVDHVSIGNTCDIIHPSNSLIKSNS